MSVIECKDLTVRIAGRTIFSGVTLRCTPGTITALTGESGSGKSTLLSTLGLIVQSSAGDVLVDGVSTRAWKSEQRRKFWHDSATFIYQDYGVIDEETLGFNVALVQQIPAQAKPGIDRALAQVGLAGRSGQLTSTLSGGEKQRLGVARALYKRANVIFADEPTASLDAKNRDAVLKLLRERADAGVTVIIATHDQAAAAICDVVYTLQTS